MALVLLYTGFCAGTGEWYRGGCGVWTLARPPLGRQQLCAALLSKHCAGFAGRGAIHRCRHLRAPAAPPLSSRPPLRSAAARHSLMLATAEPSGLPGGAGIRLHMPASQMAAWLPSTRAPKPSTQDVGMHSAGGGGGAEQGRGRAARERGGGAGRAAAGAAQPSTHAGGPARRRRCAPTFKPAARRGGAHPRAGRAGPPRQRRRRRARTRRGARRRAAAAAARSERS
jgi:hypothetical protein